MRISISNLAWDPVHDEAVARLLNEHGVHAIDVAPSKYFPDFAASRSEDHARIKQWWHHRGIDIIGMQALMFGTSGLNVFGNTEVQQSMLRHLGHVCRIGAGLGARRLVFGSPKNRDRVDLDDAQALAQAAGFFRQVGDIAQTHDVIVCLEPNPPCYGANFMTDSASTAQVVEAVAHPAIRMQLDTGAMAINGEDAALIDRYASFIGHVHASEPDLAPLGTRGTRHELFASRIQAMLPSHYVSIEMLSPKDETQPLAAIRHALGHAVTHYGGTAAHAG